MKILHIRSTSGNYGAEKVILNVLPELRTMGCDIGVFILESFSTQARSFGNQMEELSIPVTRTKPNGKWDKNIYTKLLSIVERGDFDVIHTHDYKSLFYVKSISRKNSIPLIHHMHGLLGNTINEKIYAILELVMMRNIEKIFVVSKKMEDDLNKKWFIRSPIEFCRNGINVNTVKRKTLNAMTRRLLLVARFTAEKNHMFAIDIISKLISKGRAIELNFVGEGDLEDNIKACVKKLGLVGHVNFHGYQKQLSPFYDNSDLLLITSLTEGLPMVLLEALSQALPVASTPVGEIPFLLNEGECGALIPFNLEVAAKKIDDLLFDSSALEMLGDNGLKMVRKNYSIGSQARCFFQAYKNVKLSHLGIN